MDKILKCVLLIDDNKADNFIHKAYIQKHGGVENIVMVTSGAEALEFLGSKESGDYPRPELIFLDINMPKMNGWEFLVEYEKLEEEKKGGVVVVMLTTSLNPEDKELAESKDNVRGYLNKPLKVEMFQAILEKHFPERLKQHI